MLEDNWNNKELQECVKRVFKHLSYNASSLLDCILVDDSDDPQFSANTTYAMFRDVILFERYCCGKTYESVDDYLKNIGYSGADILLFAQRREEEKRRNPLSSF